MRYVVPTKLNNKQRKLVLKGSPENSGQINCK